MKPEISIEFFPPTTAEGADKLRATREKLAALKPAFFSVTYGAGGSTRERTHATVARIAAESAVPPAAHLTCAEASRAEIDEVAAGVLWLALDAPPYITAERLNLSGGLDRD